MIKLPSAKVYSQPVSVSYPGQLLKCVKATTLGPRTLQNFRNPEMVFDGSMSIFEIP